MNKIYAEFGVAVMDSCGNRRNRNIVYKEILEAIDKQIKWDMMRVK